MTVAQRHTLQNILSEIESISVQELGRLHPDSRALLQREAEKIARHLTIKEYQYRAAKEGKENHA